MVLVSISLNNVPHVKTKVLFTTSTNHVRLVHSYAAQVIDAIITIVLLGVVPVTMNALIIGKFVMQENVLIHVLLLTAHPRFASMANANIKSLMEHVHWNQFQNARKTHGLVLELVVLT